jgi:hypothetical protein
MIGNVLGSAGRRLGPSWLCALWARFALAVVVLTAAPATAQGSTYFNRGLRWIGLARTCEVTAPGWIAQRLFRGARLPAALADYCLYAWTLPAREPAVGDVAALAATSGAAGLTEDVPVVTPAAAFTAQDEALLVGLRGQLRAQVGDVSLLPSAPSSPRTRIVVIDSAPDAAPGHIQIGTSRHGDTLAHLIEDVVCKRADDGRYTMGCAAEVSTELALPWIASGVAGPRGGYVGTLADLARAIERGVTKWQADRAAAPGTTPSRLVLNLSLGWEHTAGIADCSAGSPDLLGPPARAVRAILQHAASQGALIIAAAGNDAGGRAPRTGLVCPARFQAVPQGADPTRALLVAVSGLDYHDDPLETARPHGVTGISGLGLGGVAWDPADPVPPPLTGSSVAAAVVSAVSALVWAVQPSWSAAQVTGAVHRGGVEVGPADACPMLLAVCKSRRVSACGALHQAGAPASCAPGLPTRSSCPELPAELSGLAALHAAVPPGEAIAVTIGSIPRFVAPNVQLGPWVFPMPIAATCPTCVVSAVSAGAPYLILPAVTQTLYDPALVVRLSPDGTRLAVSLGAALLNTTPYLYELPPTWVVHAAYLTGFDAAGHSVTEQIFVGW